MSRRLAQTAGGEWLARRDAENTVPSRRPGRNWTKADVVVQPLDGRLVALKDYAPRAWLVRHTLGRWLVGREVRALAAAQGIEGLPTLLGRRGPYALATVWIDARPLASLRRDEIPPTCFEDLSRIVATLHARGVALGDLHHRDVLVDDRGGVHVVDLATAVVIAPRARALRRPIFERACELDRVAVARMRARALGLDPDIAAAEAAPRGARWHRRGRRLKSAWDRLRRR